VTPPPDNVCIDTDMCTQMACTDDASCGTPGLVCVLVGTGPDTQCCKQCH